MSGLPAAAAAIFFARLLRCSVGREGEAGGCRRWPRIAEAVRSSDGVKVLATAPVAGVGACDDEGSESDTAGRGARAGRLATGGAGAGARALGVGADWGMES